jgi:hypothetical protein
MTAALIRQVSKINSLLEEGTQECLALITKLQNQVETSIRDQVASQVLSKEDILRYLQEFSPELYRIIGDTLFRLILLMQPADCEEQEQINFYFWPGYHSYVADKRIFVQEGHWNLGVGICGDSNAEKLEHYRDCSQARWYHYLINPRNKSEVTPGDVHQWLRLQRPRFSEGSHSFINSLTVTTKLIDPDEQKMYQGHKVRHLATDPQNTEVWGEQFSEFVNNLGSVEDKSWTFPDRRGATGNRQAHLRDVRSKLTSVWIHAAFCDNKPKWLDDFIQELLSEEETLPVGRALQSALNDSVAVDWGDASRGRPRFNCWSNLSLHAWLAPSRAPMLEPTAPSGDSQQRTQASQTVGSAEFLSSVPLHPSYFAIVRQWVSSIYGMVRNAEISILFHNQQIGVHEAVLAGPYWAHELKKLIDQSSSTLLR